MNRREAARLLLALLLGLGFGLFLGGRGEPNPASAPLAAREIPRRPALPPPPSAPATAAPASTAPATQSAALLRDLGATRDLLARWFPALAEEPAPDDPDYSAERVLYDQHRLVGEALAGLRAQTPGRTDLYVVAFGGDGDENVFRNEVEYVEKLFSERYGARGRVVVLENNPATVETRPLATWSNLELVLDGLLENNRFDPEEDILLLFLTSHGDEDHYLYVGMDVLPLDWIGADDLSRMLNERPFRWRVSIVSACYSGGFVDGLKNSTSMVITAARADRTSFGCGSESDITFFGKAFFVEGLNQTDSFRGAFQIARQRIDEWEEDEKQTPSEPQIASTPLIEAKLAEWRRSVTLGPPQPFEIATAVKPVQSSEKSTKQ
ncbi:C13 family peptidase [Tahibacter sp.]|uniref:C13 family peptidase n=1 Tax=Tahibacter sp. TaxID=2056211 RepID=UPI0028C4FA29|nr:C13 family peptidase [Tahibacter sp.]